METSKRPTPSSPDANTRIRSSWRLFLCIVFFYGILFAITLRAFVSVPAPRSEDISLGLFSEGRAMRTVEHLASVIGGRQTSTRGEEVAAEWLLSEAEAIAALAKGTRPDLDVAVVREQVSGAIPSQRVFGYEISNVYNNLTNVILYIRPMFSNESYLGNLGDATEGLGMRTKEVHDMSKGPKTVLVNAHFDSPLGSPGASDCASCVAVALEIARTIVANASLHLSTPLVVLFNGGEETLMQASHGFMASSAYSKDLGAFINLESTGAWGPDILFQHSGDWTLQAYAEAAPFTRGNTVGQDFFDLGIVPADTDYRMLSWRQYGSIPGIDIAFLFGGKTYHTRQDTPSRIRPGTIQAMGENVLSVVLKFSQEIAKNRTHYDSGNNSGFVYFDILSKFMVVYSYSMAVVLHSFPLAMLILFSLLSLRGVPSVLDLSSLAMWETLPVLASVSMPLFIGYLRNLITGRAMAWYHNELEAVLIFGSAALSGLLLPKPRTARGHKAVADAPGPLDFGRESSLGFAFMFALASALMTYFRVRSSYLLAAWASAAFLSAVIVPVRTSGYSWRNVATILMCYVPPTILCLPTVISLSIHLIEKIGISGSLGDSTLALSVPDFAVGGVLGISLVFLLGCLGPHIRSGLSSRQRHLLCLYLFMLSLVSCITLSFLPEISKIRSMGEGLLDAGFPYSEAQPKRMLVQHVHHHTTSGKVTSSSYSFASIDAISASRALPEMCRDMTDVDFIMEDWLGIYPLNNLISGVAKVAPGPETGYAAPTLIARKRGILTDLLQKVVGSNRESPDPGMTRWHLELDTVHPGWAMLNISADIRAWSIGSQVPQVDIENACSTVGVAKCARNGTNIAYPAEGQALCSMVRYASSFETTKWMMWLDVPKGSHLHVDLYVKHLEGHTQEARALVDNMPSWTSPALLTTWVSSWDFCC